MYIRVAGLAASVCYSVAIVWLYMHQPQSIAEVSGSFAASVGVYQIDAKAFEEGRRLFRSGEYAASRSAFERADPAHRDAQTQFYVAYSFYREGWGRMYNDTALMAQAVDALERAISASPAGVVTVDDSDLQLKTSDELKAELQFESTHASAYNSPSRIFRQRK
jgi:hypothetical protein